MNLPRYKYLVQVVIGEQKGAGVRMGCRCFWDSQTDAVASETYVNVRRCRLFCAKCRLFASLQLNGGVCVRVRLQESLFCAVTAFGVYLY